jgi:hypothetical protein
MSKKHPNGPRLLTKNELKSRLDRVWRENKALRRKIVQLEAKVEALEHQPLDVQFGLSGGAIEESKPFMVVFRAGARRPHNDREFLVLATADRTLGTCERRQVEVEVLDGDREAAMKKAWEQIKEGDGDA